MPEKGKKQQMKFSAIADIDRRGWFYLCGFALTSCLSMAMSNVFLGLAVAAALHRCKRQRPSFAGCLDIIGRPVAVMFLAYVIATLVSLVGALDLIAGMRRILNHYFLWPSAFFSVLVFVRNRRQVFRLAEFLVLSLVLNDFYVIGQSLQVGGQMGRFGGGMFYMAYATALLTVLPLLLMYFLRSQNQRRRWAAVAAFLLCIVGLLLNGTRTVWALVLPFCLAAAYPCVSSKWKYVAGLMASLMAVGVLLAAVPNVQMRAKTIFEAATDGSYQERTRVWASAEHMWQDHPWTGVGFGSFPKAYTEKYILPEAQERQLRHAHSNVMEVLAECGSLGVITFIAFWLVFSLQALGRWRRTHEEVHLVLFFSLQAIMLHGLTEFTWDRSITMKMFWMIFGLACAWMRCGREGLSCRRL